MPVSDPIREGLDRGWVVYGGAHRPLPAKLACDLAIVGSGAGAGVTAELAARSGLKVLLVEEGPLRSSSDFHQLESEAYPGLYQESAARKTADKAITILQGRCVGGSTTINWTSSFRTPSATLAHWRERFGLTDLTEDALSPWFAQAERRLGIGPWLTPPNENNDLLRRGAMKMGIAAPAILRNVRGCWNLGSCGLGCPTNAKQSMLVTTLPAALERGAQLCVETRAERLELVDGKVRSLLIRPVRPDGSPVAEAQPARVEARHYVVAGGAMNSPALLLRSGAPDPHGRLGRRTFLHPAVISAATFEQRIEPWQGAPQSIYSDHFLDAEEARGAIGFKVEAAPVHPLIYSTTASGFGRPLRDAMQQLAHTHALVAFMRDGFDERAAGGTVSLRSDGGPLLEYPLTDYLWEGARRALAAMAEIQFAAGARAVTPAHELARPYSTWKEAREAIATLPMQPLLTRVASAHVMGGCAMASDPARGVVDPDGAHWQLANLSIHDGSLFPTSIGANPQLSIYGLVARLATALVQRLGATPVPLG